MDDLIRRQDAIDAVIEWYGCEPSDLEYFKKIVEKKPSAQKRGEWIPCSERLPDNDDIMLVSCRTKKGVNSVNRAYYADGFWHGSGSMSGVTAWMLLPEPYTKENDRKGN